MKVINIVLGLGLTIFGGYFYYALLNDDEDTQKTSYSILGYILPGYIGLSGIIMLAIEMHIKVMIRNMKFLYNYIGRGFFNIYAGVMPLTLL